MSERAEIRRFERVKKSCHIHTLPHDCHMWLTCGNRKVVFYHPVPHVANPPPFRGGCPCGKTTAPPMWIKTNPICRFLQIR